MRPIGLIPADILLDGREATAVPPPRGFTSLPTNKDIVRMARAYFEAKSQWSVPVSGGTQVPDVRSE